MGNIWRMGCLSDMSCLRYGRATAEGDARRGGAIRRRTLSSSDMPLPRAARPYVSGDDDRAGRPTPTAASPRSTSRCPSASACRGPGSSMAGRGSCLEELQRGVRGSALLRNGDRPRTTRWGSGTTELRAPWIADAIVTATERSRANGPRATAMGSMWRTGCLSAMSCPRR